MYALIGLSGIVLFLISIPMVIIKWKTNRKFWLTMMAGSLAITIGALAATPLPEPEGSGVAAIESNADQPISETPVPVEGSELALGSSAPVEPDPQNSEQAKEGNAETEAEIEEADSTKIASAALREYMFENFGGGGDPKYAAYWYDNIKGIALKPDGDAYDVTVVTDIYPDSDADRIAPSIARAVLYNGEVNVQFVTIKGQENSILGTWYITTAP